ncbi:MAG TPA: hypothetical protein VFV93_07720 [Thermomicrobiales bacterium]|nr:hypothetical protein [Thermomicrobiales bacterium]
MGHPACLAELRELQCIAHRAHDRFDLSTSFRISVDRLAKLAKAVRRTKVASEFDTIGDSVAILPHADQAFFVHDPEQFGSRHRRGATIRYATIALWFFALRALHDLSTSPRNAAKQALVPEAAMS